MNYSEVCIQCKAGFHEQCESGWDEGLAELQLCCCNGLYSAIAHWKQVMEAELGDMPSGSGASPSPRVQNSIGGVTTNHDGSARKRGNSGYIAPAAWPGPKDIGTLADAESTGRKRVKQMYPIKPGTVCEWANLAAAGGGVIPVIGCLGNPATDWHHGPDKNTLDNEKRSLGIGDSENVHIVCAFCHNAWHAANDPHYPEYDRQAQQSEPWLPEGEFEVHDPQSRASFDALVEAEQARREKAESHGVQRRGRTSGAAVNTDAWPDDPD